MQINRLSAFMARLERFELPTARFVAEYSIQLSYRRFVVMVLMIPRRTLRGRAF